MKKTHSLIFALLCLMTLGPALGCDNERGKEPVIEFNEDAWKRERTEFVNNSRETLAGAERRIQELNSKLEGADEAAKAQYQESIAELREIAKKSENALERAESATAESWKNAKQEASEDLNELERAYNRVLEKLKTDET